MDDKYRVKNSYIFNFTNKYAQITTIELSDVVRMKNHEKIFGQASFWAESGPLKNKKNCGKQDCCK